MSAYHNILSHCSVSSQLYLCKKEKGGISDQLAGFVSLCFRFLFMKVFMGIMVSDDISAPYFAILSHKYQQH
jgi:hypothetical protein